MKCAIAALLVLLSACAGTAAEWPPLRTGRTEIAAARLGDSVYVAGGIGWLRTLASCERLDLSERRWRDCPALPRPLHHVALAAADGRLYAAGGFARLPFHFDADPALWSLAEGEHSWRREAALPGPIGEHAMLGAPGALYLIGGRTPAGDSAALWRYRLRERRWQRLADMPTARNSAAAAWLDGDIVVTGGRSRALGDGINRVERYDPAGDRWHRSTPLPIGVGGHAAAALGGRLWVFGGERFNPDRLLALRASWAPGEPAWRRSAALEPLRHGLAAVALDDCVLLIGGATRAGWASAVAPGARVECVPPD